ncbi:MAG: hypothetical protein AAF567_18980 [Actinomycetota bacterium]
MTGREHAREVFAGVRLTAGQVVAVTFEDRALPTTSFIDEMIQIILVEGDAAQLRLDNVGLKICELASESAEYFEVADRLDCRTSA